MIIEERKEVEGLTLLVVQTVGVVVSNKVFIGVEKQG